MECSPLFLLCELCHNVRFPVHGKLLAVNLDLVSAKLREQNLVPDGDTHRHGLTRLGPSAGAHSHHNSLICLGLSFLGNQETALGSRLCSSSLNENSVEERHDPLGNGGHDRHDEKLEG